MAAKEERNEGVERLTSLREALDVYVSGRSGIRFSALARFAGPLFDLYDVDWRADGGTAVPQRDAEELSTMIAVLDTGRLLWTFFELSDDERIEWLPELEDALLGPGASDEERSNLLVLLSLLEEHWEAFSRDERRDAVNTPGFALPDFDKLLAVHRDLRLPRTRPSTYGPLELELPEALAVFAEPLLQDAALDDDPSLVQERMERAQAYWELATAAAGEFDSHLQRIQDNFATNDRERSAIREEANRMVSRFNSLFPEYEADD